MAPAELDNANPTIISASELPTRQKRAAPRKGPDSKYADIIFAKPSYLSRPLYYNDAAAPLWPGADDGDGVADAGGGEPIDEQEIYGKKGQNVPVFLKKKGKKLTGVLL